MHAKVFRSTHSLHSFFMKKKLTPMAVMYQVRYPSVSGTGADWRNLELSPLPLSDDQYVFNKRRYHQPQELCHWAVKEKIMLYIYQIFMVKIWLVGWSERWIYFKICSMFNKSWSRIFEELDTQPNKNFNTIFLLSIKIAEHISPWCMQFLDTSDSTFVAAVRLEFIQIV